MMLDIRPINSEADHEWALKEIEQYFDKEPKKGSKEAARFDILATLIEAYEAKHYPIEDPEPIPYLKGMMEMQGRNRADLARLLGSRARASEVLARRRYLSKAMILKISREWHIPADPLMKLYRLVESKAATRGTAMTGTKKFKPSSRTRAARRQVA